MADEKLRALLSEAKSKGASEEQLIKLIQAYEGGKKKDSSESPSTGGAETTDGASTSEQPTEQPFVPLPSALKKSMERFSKTGEVAEELPLAAKQAAEPKEKVGGSSVVIENIFTEESAKYRKAQDALIEYDKLFQPKETKGFGFGGTGETVKYTESEEMSEENLKLAKDRAVKKAGEALGVDLTGRTYEEVQNIVNGGKGFAEQILAENTLEKAKEEELKDPTKFGLTRTAFWDSFIDKPIKELGIRIAVARDDYEAAEKFQQDINERVNRTQLSLGIDPTDSRGITETWEDGDTDAAIYKGLYGAAGSTGGLLLTIAAPNTGIAYFGTSSYLSTYNSYVDRGDLTWEQKESLALIAGATEVAVAKLMGGINNVKRFRNAVGISDDIGKATMAEQRAAYNKVMDFLEPYGKKFTDVMKKPAVRGAIRTGYETASEAVEEGVVEIINQVAAHSIANDEYDAYAIYDSMILGAAMGGPMGSITGFQNYRAINSIYKRPLAEDLENYETLQAQYKDLKQAMKEEADPAKKKIIKEVLGEVRQEIKEINKKADAAYNKLNDDEAIELYNLHKQIEQVSRDAKQSKSPAVKKALGNKIAGLLVRKGEIEAKAGIKAEVDTTVEPTGATEVSAQESAPAEAASFQDAQQAIADLEVKRKQRLEEAKGRDRSATSPAINSIDTRVRYLNPATNETVEGVLAKDGGRLVVETDEGNIIEVGEYERLKDRSLESLDLSAAEGLLDVNPDGSFTYRPVAGAKGSEQGTKMYNRNGVKAIRRDRSGNIKNVLLTSEDGSKTYNLKGAEAEEAAYQILLRETQTPEGTAKVNEALAQEAEDRALRQADEAREPAGEPQEQPQEQPQRPRRREISELINGSEKIADEARAVLSRYMVALSRVSPDHQITILDTAADVKAVWDSLGGNPDGNPIAFNDPSTNTIYVHTGLFENVQRGQGLDIVKHEFIHPILDAVFRSSKGARAELTRGVLDILNSLPHTNAAKRAVFNHARKYADNDTYAVELLTEFFNQFSSASNLEDAIKAEPTFLDKIVAMLNEFLSKFTSFRIKRGTPAEGVKQLLKSIHDSFTQGLPLEMDALRKSYNDQLQAYDGIRRFPEYLVKTLEELVLDEFGGRAISEPSYVDESGLIQTEVFLIETLDDAVRYLDQLESKLHQILYKNPVVKAGSAAAAQALMEYGYRNIGGDTYALPAYNEFSDAELIKADDFVDIKDVPSPKRFLGLQTAAKSLGVDVRFLNSSTINASSGYLLPNVLNGLEKPAVFINLDEFNRADTFFGLGAFIVDALRNATSVKGKLGSAYLMQMENAVKVVENKISNGVELTDVEKDFYYPLYREISVLNVTQVGLTRTVDPNGSTNFAHALAKVLGEKLLEFQDNVAGILTSDDVTIELIEEFNDVINAAASIEGESPSFRLSNVAAHTPKDILNAVFIDRILDNVEYEDDVKTQITEAVKNYSGGARRRNFRNIERNLPYGVTGLGTFNDNVDAKDISDKMDFFLKIEEAVQKRRDELKQKEEIFLYEAGEALIKPYPVEDFDFEASKTITEKASKVALDFSNLLEDVQFDQYDRPTVLNKITKVIGDSQMMLAARTSDIEDLITAKSEMAAFKLLEYSGRIQIKSIPYLEKLVGASSEENLLEILNENVQTGNKAHSAVASYLNRFKKWVDSGLFFPNALSAGEDFNLVKIRPDGTLSSMSSEREQVNAFNLFNDPSVDSRDWIESKAEWKIIQQGYDKMVLLTLTNRKGEQWAFASTYDLIDDSVQSVFRKAYPYHTQVSERPTIPPRFFYDNRSSRTLGGLSLLLGEALEGIDQRYLDENNILATDLRNPSQILSMPRVDLFEVNGIVPESNSSETSWSRFVQSIEGELNLPADADVTLYPEINYWEQNIFGALDKIRGETPFTDIIALALKEGMDVRNKTAIEIVKEYAEKAIASIAPKGDMTFDDAMSKLLSKEVSFDALQDIAFGSKSFSIDLPNAPDGYRKLDYRVSIGQGGYVEFKTNQFGYDDIPEKWGAGPTAQGKILDWLQNALRFSPNTVGVHFSPATGHYISEFTEAGMRARGKSQDYIDKYAYTEEEIKRGSNNFKRRTLYNLWALSSFGQVLGIAHNPTYYSDNGIPDSYGNSQQTIISRDRGVYEAMGMDPKAARLATKAATKAFQEHGQRVDRIQIEEINDELVAAGFEPVPSLTAEIAVDVIKYLDSSLIKNVDKETNPVDALRRYLDKKSMITRAADNIKLSYIMKPSVNKDGSLSIPKITNVAPSQLQAYVEGMVDGSDILEALEDLREQERDFFKDMNKRDKVFSWSNITKAWVNRNQNLRDAVRKGMNAYVKSLLTKRNGYVLYADRMFKRYDKKIFGGTTMGEETTIDDIIFLRRVVQIDKNRDLKKENLNRLIDVAQSELESAQTEQEKKIIQKRISELQKGLESAERPQHPKPQRLENIGGAINLESATKALAAIEQRIGSEAFNKLNKRADEYFNAYQDILAYAKDIGLIDAETYTRFASDDYSPRLFLDKMFGEASDIAFKGTNLSEDFIKSLKDGSNGDIFSDARTMLSLSLRSIRAKDIQNRIMQAMHADAKRKGFRNIDFMKELNTTTTNGKKKVQKASKGFTNVYYRVNGKLEGFQIKSDMRDALFNNVKDYIEIPSRGMRWIRRLSGTSLLKSFATGTNTAFALTSAIRFVPEAVLGRGVYDKYRLLPVMATVATLDILRAAGDAIFNKALVEEYMEAGGETIWLSSSGKPKMAYKRKEQSLLASAFNKLAATGFEGISWAANKSELAARLALYKRTKDNLQKAHPNMPLEEVKSLAVEEAIMLADFATSGTMGKNVDLVSAYFNPAIQGFRGAASYARSNPKKFIGKLSQFYVASTVLQLLAMLSMDDEEWDRIPDYQKQMYLHVPVGRDADGNPQTLKLPRAHTFLPVSAAATITAEHIRDIVRGNADRKKDVKSEDLMDDGAYMFDSVLKGLPLPSIPVLGNAFLVLNYNIDPWTGEEVYKGGGDKEMWEFVKGQQDKKVRDFYKYMTLLGYDAGIADVSPKKLQVAVEKLITSDKNFLVDQIYDIADALAIHGGKLDKLQEKYGIDSPALIKKKKDNIEALFGVKGRIYTVPDKKYDDDYPVRKARMDKNTRMQIMKNNIKDSAKEYAKTKNIESVPKDVVDKINSMTENPFERKALVQYWKYYYRGKLVDNEIVNLMFSDSAEERVAKLEAIVGDLSKMSQEDYNDVLRDLKIAGMNKDTEFLYLVSKKRKK